MIRSDLPKATCKLFAGIPYTSDNNAVIGSNMTENPVVASDKVWKINWLFHAFGGRCTLSWVRGKHQVVDAASCIRVAISQDTAYVIFKFIVECTEHQGTRSYSSNQHISRLSGGRVAKDLWENTVNNLLTINFSSMYL